jgi:hypothetical protein
VLRPLGAQYAVSAITPIHGNALAPSQAHPGLAPAHPVSQRSRNAIQALREAIHGQCFARDLDIREMNTRPVMFCVHIFYAHKICCLLNKVNCTCPL